MKEDKIIEEEIEASKIDLNSIDKDIKKIESRELLAIYRLLLEQKEALDNIINKMEDDGNER